MYVCVFFYLRLMLINDSTTELLTKTLFSFLEKKGMHTNLLHGNQKHLTGIWKQEDFNYVGFDRFRHTLANM